MSHRRTFPALVEQVDDQYKLFIWPVEQSRRLEVAPPVTVGLVEGGLWPKHSFQLLLVASEYCAALQDFLAWSFPPEWEPLKAQVARHAADLIHTSDVVPPPQPQAGWNDPRALEAYRVWAAFTHCYFCGTGNLQPPEEVDSAVRWLRRLVGRHGWRKHEAVHSAAERWVLRMRESLRLHFQGLDGMTAAEWPYGGMDRVIESRAGFTERDEPYVPVYPYRICGTFGGNRIKFTVKKEKGPRDVSEVKGKCGVPVDFGQTHNCALGFLVLSDVMQAFFEASTRWDKNDATVQQLVKSFFDEVLKSERPHIPEEHMKYHYPAYMAACALGWDFALQHLEQWVVAAESTAANARGAGPFAPGLLPQHLLLPQLMPAHPQGDIGALHNLHVPAHDQQQQQQQQQQHAGQQRGDPLPLQPRVQQQQYQPGAEGALPGWQLPHAAGQALPVALVQQQQQLDPEDHNPQQQQQANSPFLQPLSVPLPQSGLLPPRANAPSAIAAGAGHVSPSSSLPRSSPLSDGLQPGPLLLPPHLGSGTPMALPGSFSAGSSGSAQMSPFAAMQQSRSVTCPSPSLFAAQHLLPLPLSHPLNPLQLQHKHPQNQYLPHPNPLAAWEAAAVGPLGASTSHLPPDSRLPQPAFAAAPSVAGQVQELRLPSPPPLPGQQQPRNHHFHHLHDQPSAQPSQPGQCSTVGDAGAGNGAGAGAVAGMPPEDVVNSISIMSLDGIPVGDESIFQFIHDIGRSTSLAGTAAATLPAGNATVAAAGGGGVYSSAAAGGACGSTSVMPSPYQPTQAGVAAGEQQSAFTLAAGAPGLGLSPCFQLPPPPAPVAEVPPLPSRRTITTCPPAPSPRHPAPPSPELFQTSAGADPSQHLSPPPSPRPGTAPPPTPPMAATINILDAATTAAIQLQGISNHLHELLQRHVAGRNFDLLTHSRVEQLHRDVESALRRFSAVEAAPADGGARGGLDAVWPSPGVAPTGGATRLVAGTPGEGPPGAVAVAVTQPGLVMAEGLPGPGQPFSVQPPGCEAVTVTIASAAPEGVTGGAFPRGLVPGAFGAGTLRLPSVHPSYAAQPLVPVSDRAVGAAKTAACGEPAAAAVGMGGAETLEGDHTGGAARGGGVAWQTGDGVMGGEGGGSAGEAGGDGGGGDASIVDGEAVVWNSSRDNSLMAAMEALPVDGSNMSWAPVGSVSFR